MESGVLLDGMIVSDSWFEIVGFFFCSVSLLL